ncbi:MAG: zinc-binding dehydrogenase [Alphaproteobacteria bacterium]|nr:zinc-binding dehydrogenase [Alphaproteobacteria bacterium]
MRSFQVVSFGKPLCEAVKATPTPSGSEVVVKITACGVCHSDVHLWEGYFDLGGGRKAPVGGGKPDYLPLTLGHEPAGEVIAVGPDAKGVKVGDRRVVYPWIGCGACSICKAGDEHVCNNGRVIGVNRDGGYADHVVVPHPRYLVDFPGVPEALAATYACSGITAYGALKRAGKLAPDQPLVIIGAGGVGFNGIRLAKAVTGQAPVVVDIDLGKKDAALSAGASAFIDANAPDAGKQIFGLTKGAWAVIDFVGSDKSSVLGFNALRRGGRMVIVGLFGGTFAVPVPLFPLKSATVMGSYVGSLAEFLELRDLVVSGALPPMPIKTRKLDEINAVMEEMVARKIVGRVVLTP